MARAMNQFHVGLTLWLLALALAGCSTAPVKEGEPIEPVFPAGRVLGEDITYAADVYDPWEGFNRAMYRFNYRFDKYVFLPAVNAYQTVTPDLAEQGVHNWFNNFRDVMTVINSLLQASPRKALQTAGRVAANTTFGMFGLIDVATTMGLPRYEEDFGQTMGRWGMGSGPRAFVTT
jgi:phospholipid-binding lipoprotein MlaA